jgi:hypothetical protein
VARSTDGGATWVPHDTGVRDGFCNGLATAPGGVVTVVFLDGSGYGTVTSPDGGASWRAPVRLGQLNSANLPSIAWDAGGRFVIAAIAGQASAQVEVSLEGADGVLKQQWQLPSPTSRACTIGRLIQPAVTAAPGSLAALQIACKLDATSSSAGVQEVWLYPSIDQPSTPAVSVEVTSFELPIGTLPRGQFPRRFPDGGDYWALTWRSAGVFSMWVDPRTGGGPGNLMGAPVTN